MHLIFGKLDPQISSHISGGRPLPPSLASLVKQLKNQLTSSEIGASNEEVHFLTDLYQ